MRFRRAEAEVWHRYDMNLRDWAAVNQVQLPTVPDNVEQSFHMYYMILPSVSVRGALIQHLKDRGILSVFHYQPLHLSTMGQGFGGKSGDCPVTEDIADRLLRLPFFFSFSRGDQDEVIEALLAFTEWQ